MQYKDFIIKIESKQGEDYIINIRSPAGEGTSKLRLPFKLDDAAGMMQKLAGTFRGVSSPEIDAEATREMSMSSAITTPSIELPKALFDSLFIGATKTLFDQSIGMIRGEDSGLRIKLQIDPTDSEVAALASLPWELLYREETRDYLNLSRNTPLVRYLNVQRPFAPESFVLPLRILVVMSSPEGVAALNLEQERQLIEQSWARQSGVEVDFLERPATTQRLSDKLTEKDYHVLHYMGHGDFDRDTGHGVLLLEDENSQPQALDGQTLGGVILHDVKSLRLVFLNACDTAKATQKEGQDPFAGVATAMIMAGIPAVVAMQFPITDKAAVSFAGTFYPRIVSGYPVDAAVAEGRKAIKLADSSTMEWATPVLFMRSPDGVLFDIDKPMPAVEPLPKPGSKPPSNRTDDAAPAQKIQEPVTQAPATQAPVTQKSGMSNTMKRALGAAAGLVLIVLAYFISSYILSSEAKIPPIAEKGYSVKQATDIVETAGLMVAPDTVGVASSKSEGVVLRTDPPEGISYDVDKEVRLVVSNGTIELESLEGKTEDEIRSLFEKLPVSIMAVESVVTLPAQSIADGTFVRSEPDANNAIPHDTAFTLYMGASGIPIPELVSLDLNEAIIKLKEVGLTYETRYELILDGKDGKIFKTEPAADTRLVASAPVMLVISARGGWVYLGKEVSDVYQNDAQAKTMRSEDDNGGKRMGTLKARETVKVIKSKRNGWTLVRDNDQ
jgi:beta-lactam-binding protein with PASTA domain